MERWQAWQLAQAWTDFLCRDFSSTTWRMNLEIAKIVPRASQICEKIAWKFLVWRSCHQDISTCQHIASITHLTWAKIGNSDLKKKHTWIYLRLMYYRNMFSVSQIIQTWEFGLSRSSHLHIVEEPRDICDLGLTNDFQKLASRHDIHMFHYFSFCRCL